MYSRTWTICNLIPPYTLTASHYFRSPCICRWNFFSINPALFCNLSYPSIKTQLNDTSFRKPDLLSPFPESLISFVGYLVHVACNLFIQCLSPLSWMLLEDRPWVLFTCISSIPRVGSHARWVLSNCVLREWMAKGVKLLTHHTQGWFTILTSVVPLNIILDIY